MTAACPQPLSPHLPLAQASPLSSGKAKAAAQDLLGLHLQSTTQVCIQTHFRSHLPGSSCPGLILELVVPWPVYLQLQSLPLFLLCPPLWTLPPELILETSVLAHLTYPYLRIPGLFESLLLIDLFSLLVRQLDSHLHSFPVSLVPVSSCFLGSCVLLNTHSLASSCPYKTNRGHLDGKASRQFSG